MYSVPYCGNVDSYLQDLKQGSGSLSPSRDRLALGLGDNTTNLSDNENITPQDMRHHPSEYVLHTSNVQSPS